MKIRRRIIINGVLPIILVIVFIDGCQQYQPMLLDNACDYFGLDASGFGDW